MTQAHVRRKRSNLKYFEREDELLQSLSAPERENIDFCQLRAMDIREHLPNEIWMGIAGWENHFIISNFCRIKNIRTGNILFCHLHHSGYLTISFSYDGEKKYYTVSKLLATAFIPNPKNKPQVNHKNGIRVDNRLENIEWVWPSENIIHSYDVTKRVGRKKVIQMDMGGNFIALWHSFSSIKRKLGYSVGNICSNCRGKLEYAYGYKWKYA